MRKYSQYMLSALLFTSALSGILPAQAVELVTYYHNDPLGSPLAATDEHGDELWSETYRPFGERIVNDSKAADNRVWYTGKPHDSATGLSYYGARYYDPVLGRFMAIDPVGFQDDNLHSFNRYTYANNNPYKYVDPDGRSAVTKAIKFVLNGGDFAATFADVAKDIRVLTSSSESLGARAFAAASIASEFSPVSVNDLKVVAKVTKGTKPLLGKNPKVTKARTNTDLPGDKATAKSIFRNQTKGQKVKDFDLQKGGIGRKADDGTQIRFNPDGSTRLDLPNRGPNPPGRETIHIGP